MGKIKIHPVQAIFNLPLYFVLAVFSYPRLCNGEGAKVFNEAGTAFSVVNLKQVLIPVTRLIIVGFHGW